MDQGERIKNLSTDGHRGKAFSDRARTLRARAPVMLLAAHSVVKALSEDAFKAFTVKRSVRSMAGARSARVLGMRLTTHFTAGANAAAMPGGRCGGTPPLEG
jgi:hypothetical protein